MSPAHNKAAVARAFAALVNLDLETLRGEWRRLYRVPPPPAFKRDLLLRGIAHRLDSDATGDIDRTTARLLNELAGTTHPAAVLARRRTRQIKPGCELLREWNGTMHRVVVLKRGFAWNGETYASLSMIARTITGTRWNGHRFFGVDRGETCAKTEPKDRSGSAASRAGSPAGRGI